MDGGVPELGREPPDIVERDSLAISQPVEGLVIRRGDEGFTKEIKRLYPIAENNAAEHLVALKARLRDASSEEFWASVTKGLAELTDANMRLFPRGSWSTMRMSRWRCRLLVSPVRV